MSFISGGVVPYEERAESEIENNAENPTIPPLFTIGHALRKGKIGFFGLSLSIPAAIAAFLPLKAAI